MSMHPLLSIRKDSDRQSSLQKQSCGARCDRIALVRRPPYTVRRLKTDLR